MDSHDDDAGVWWSLGKMVEIIDQFEESMDLDTLV
jgi:hypothetical protein